MSCSEVWENLTFLGKRNKNTHKRNEEGAGPALTVEGRVWPLAATNSGQPHQANQAARLASIAILLICLASMIFFCSCIWSEFEYSTHIVLTILTLKMTVSPGQTRPLMCMTLSW